MNPMKQAKSLLSCLSCRATVLVLRWLACFPVWRLLCPDVRAIECFSTVAALWWTLLLLGTPRIFSTSHLFNGLAERGKEREWGLATALLSCLGMWVVLGASATVRFFAAALSFMLWVFVALNLSQSVPWVHPTLFGVQLAFSVPESTGAGVYAGLALFSAWACGKLGPHVIFDAYNGLKKCQNKWPGFPRAAR